MKNETTEILEWSVWVQLDSVNDVELILLKGHLFLEVVINAILSENSLENAVDYSFFKKIETLNLIQVEEKQSIKNFQFHLYELNKIRNKLAHEFSFNVKDGQLEAWSSNVLATCKGYKFSRYTYRTKIVHAFSVLAGSISRINSKL